MDFPLEYSDQIVSQCSLPNHHVLAHLDFFLKGLASYRKAETTFTFHFSFLTLSNAFLTINNREMKSESAFSFAMASQPFR